MKNITIILTILFLLTSCEEKNNTVFLKSIKEINIYEYGKVDSIISNFNSKGYLINESHYSGEYVMEKIHYFYDTTGLLQKKEWYYLGKYWITSYFYNENRQIQIEIEKHYPGERNCSQWCILYEYNDFDSIATRLSTRITNNEDHYLGKYLYDSNKRLIQIISISQYVTCAIKYDYLENKKENYLVKKTWDCGNTLKEIDTIFYNTKKRITKELKYRFGDCLDCSSNIYCYKTTYHYDNLSKLIKKTNEVFSVDDYGDYGQEMGSITTYEYRY
jgi:hypothetical protein